jgi:glycosyltransferase involved in cell wall biosynthesis
VNTAVTSRICARAKFFFDGERKFYLNGVTYGPFRPTEDPEVYFKSKADTRRDFEMIRGAGLNTVRVYHQPPLWFFDLAAEQSLRVLTTIPWPLRGLFLDDANTRREVRRRVHESARLSRNHPALFGFFIDNEMQPDLVRWYGPRRVENFFDSLVQIIKSEDPSALTSYANFPPTEYLLPKSVDFYSYNVYLHNRKDLSGYLARLQNLAEEKPLVLGEFGMDTQRHGEEEQAGMIETQLEEVYRGGLAGSIIFSWTDEWFTGGMEIEDWSFGVVTRDRRPKKSYQSLQAKLVREGGSVAGHYPLEPWPKAAVVVCSYNGAKTLRGCLEALGKLNYPNYEVILVDDGSTDHTQEIMKDFPDVRNIRQVNKGLSVARNVGAQASDAAIIAYTDSDCMPDEDWLYHLVHTLMRGDYAAVGGPNISPPAANWVQAAVAAAPGSPSHVLLTDTEAEHVPGCNMAFHRWALDMIDGFDAEFRKAGDDVDVFWRLIALGQKIGFSPSAVVWHHRRFTVKAYFGQQKGYGEAESLLRYKHLNYFDAAGSARWKGAIYGQPTLDSLFMRPVIYHGVFGMGFFQCVYRRPMSEWASLVSSLEWNIATLFILFLSVEIEFLRIVPLLMFGGSVLAALSYMLRTRMEAKHDTIPARLLLFYLAYAQPIKRGWARYFTWLQEKRTPAAVIYSKEEKPHGETSFFGSGQLDFWSENGKGRTELLAESVEFLEEEGWKYALDTGWTSWDVQVFANRFWHIRLHTLSEFYPQGRRLTRVSLDLLVSTFSMFLALLFVGVATVCCLYEPRLTGAFGGLALFLTLAVWLQGLRIRRRIAALVQAAAGKLAFLTLDPAKSGA